MKISVHLVTWNGAKYLPYLLESLKNQSYKDWQLLVLDNGSQDDTVTVLEKELAGRWCDYEIIKNQTNTGFAPAHNQLWEKAQKSAAEFILLVNQDLYLLSDCLEQLVKRMEQNPEVGAVTPRLMRWDFVALLEKKPLNTSFTQQIDSLGLKRFHSGRVVDINKYATLAGQVTGAAEVFGVSGALPLYRRRALEQVGLFDEDYFCYKEDVDLAYRLRRAGWRSEVALEAVAYHDRSASRPTNESYKAVLDNRRNKSSIANYYSYRNHLFTLYKNLGWRDWLRGGGFILQYEFRKFVYLLLFERRTLWGGWLDFFRLWPKMRKKKEQVLSLKKHV